MLYINLGKRIREKRLSNKMSISEMARLLHFSYQHLSNIERGKAKPSIELLIQISSLLNVSTDYLLQDSLQIDIPEQSKTLLSDMEDYLSIQYNGIVELQRILNEIS